MTGMITTMNTIILTLPAQVLEMVTAVAFLFHLYKCALRLCFRLLIGTASEYLYQRGQQEGWDLSDYVTPEEFDDTGFSPLSLLLFAFSFANAPDLVTRALQNLKPLLEGSAVFSDDEIIATLRYFLDTPLLTSPHHSSPFSVPFSHINQRM